MKWILPMVLASFWAQCAAAAGVSINTGFFTGERYLHMSRDQREDQVEGIVNGILLAPMFGGSESRTNALVTCLNGVTQTQLTAMVDKYVKANPERWNDGLNVLVYSTLINFCPAMAPP